MKQYKIIFVDIDDTLVSKGGSISTYTKNIMKKAKEKGILVVINSGRNLDYAIKMSKNTDLGDYVISSNGAEVYNYKEDKVIFNQQIPKEILKKIDEYCKETNSTLMMNSFTNRFCNNPKYCYDKEPVTFYDDINKIIEDNIVNQLVVISTNYDRMLVLPSLFKEKFPDIKVVHSSKALSEGRREKNREYYHDFVLNNTSKGRGIVELLDYLKISKKETMAIGNGYDDISMMDVVGITVAVENATPALKEITDYITDTCDNDGVAKIIEKLCLDNN